MVIYKENYDESDGSEGFANFEDCICDVVKCDLDGNNKETLLSNVRIHGFVSCITETYLEYSFYDNDTDTNQKYRLYYN